MSDASTNGDLEAYVERLDDATAAKVEVNMVINELVDETIDLTADPSENTSALTALVDRIAKLESEVESLQHQMPEYGTKQAKIKRLLEFAARKRSSEQSVVLLSAEEIRGATGISQRYSHQWTHPEDGLPSQYPWILPADELDRFGGAELDKDDAPRKIAIDFEGVHGTAAPVNKFITGNGKNPPNTPEEGT